MHIITQAPKTYLPEMSDSADKIRLNGPQKEPSSSCRGRQAFQEGRQDQCKYHQKASVSPCIGLSEQLERSCDIV